MPSPSLRRQLPHLISFIASRFLWVKHPIDSPHSVQGGGPCRLAGVFCRLGLLPVLPDRQGSPVFFKGCKTQRPQTARRQTRASSLQQRPSRPTLATSGATTPRASAHRPGRPACLRLVCHRAAPGQSQDRCAAARWGQCVVAAPSRLASAERSQAQPDRALEPWEIQIAPRPKRLQSLRQSHPAIPAPRPGRP